MIGVEKQASLSVGQLASRAGVTVRTIQYYDQQGLLAPSEKGAQNRRLYNEDAVEELYRIMVLKYLGLSLSEIRERGDFAPEDDDALFEELVMQRMDALDEELQHLLRRFSSLRELLKERSSAEGDGASWEQRAHTIERCQGDSSFFWQLTCVRDDAAADGSRDAALRKKRSVAAWHDLVAEVISLIAAGEPAEGPAARSVAQRYRAMAQGGASPDFDGDFILMENIVPHHGGENASFDELRERVTDYLARAVRACEQDRPDGDASRRTEGQKAAAR